MELLELNKEYHYTYIITNIIENKHYYGVRSCNCNSIDIVVLFNK